MTAATNRAGATIAAGSNPASAAASLVRANKRHRGLACRRYRGTGSGSSRAVIAGDTASVSAATSAGSAETSMSKT